MLDIFNNQAFSVTSLTDALRDIKYRPSRIQELGLFQTSSVSTLTIAIERVGDILQRIKPTPRGAPGETRDMPKRNLRDFRLRHFKRDWAVLADEVQGIRAFGSETALNTVQGLVMDKMMANMADFDLEEEAQRLGAIGGVITFADGTTQSLYTEFGVTEVTEVDFDLDNATPVDGVLRKACVGRIRAMKKALGGVNFGSIHAFCGDNFFDDLLQHKEVRDTYKGWSEATILRDSYVGPNRGSNPMFQFGGIVFENYGEIDGEGIGIATDKCRFFPLGVPGLFRTFYGPADYSETVNTLGTRLYAKQEPLKFNRGIEGEVQMNALQLATRPGALFGARRT